MAFQDERRLTRALASVTNIYEPRGQNEEELVQEAASNLIILSASGTE